MTGNTAGWGPNPSVLIPFIGFCEAGVVVGKAGYSIFKAIKNHKGRLAED